MVYVKEDLLHGNPDTHENRQVRLVLYSETGMWLHVRTCTRVSTCVLEKMLKI